jgi:hypothetical protein
MVVEIAQMVVFSARKPRFNVRQFLVRILRDEVAIDQVFPPWFFRFPF